MTRSQAPLVLAGLAGLIALAALAFIAGGSTGPGSDAERRDEVEASSSSEDVDDAELVGVGREDEPARVVAEAVTTAPTDEVAAPRPASLSGVVAVPPGFPAGGTIELVAWPAGDTDAAPLSAEQPGAERVFGFEELAAGSWVVSARATASDRIAWGRSEVVDLFPGEERTGLRVALQEYVVVGTVTDASGVPIPNLEISYDWSGSDEFAGEVVEGLQPFTDFGDFDVQIAQSNAVINLSSIPVLSSESLSSGLISFEEVIIEDSEESFSEDEVMEEPMVSDVAILDATTEAPAELEALARRALEIQMDSLNATGGWIDAGSGIRLSTVNELPAGNTWSVSSRAAHTVRTDAGGVFRIALPGPGGVTVRAPGNGDDEEGARYIQDRKAAQVSEEMPTAEMAFELQRAATVEGRVVRSDGQTEGLLVFLRSQRGGSTETGRTDADGRFRFGGLLEGDYLFYARSGGNQGQDFCSHQEITVGDGEVYVLDDILTASSSLEGQLIGADGLPLEGKRVTAYGAKNRNLSRQGTTGPGGQFRIEGMYPCEYVLEVQGVELTQEARVSLPPRGALVSVGVLAVKPSEGKR